MRLTVSFSTSHYLLDHCHCMSFLNSHRFNPWLLLIILRAHFVVVVRLRDLQLMLSCIDRLRVLVHCLFMYFLIDAYGQTAVPTNKFDG